MREKGSKRRSKFLSTEASRDFKDGLFSVFVDNLNSSVDQRSLWDIFKPFGMVKDVFLSSEHRARRSNYAFVQFATTEETERVVQLTNGMHVYGWPIISKVATFGWDTRRQEERKGVGRKEKSARGSWDFNRGIKRRLVLSMSKS
ncbi:hypothetical protein Ddye_006866 [Dipteronia dyeriana]|uniref:RRM domain-containing protein n=1 Tax=Dipteronia dyeriana TaxID=168575 RepID=A0AAD9XJ82_9ROSI|nr:hypothetical protein Ddye_006866 [Dipteronia dyeriana]